jgi:carbamoyltransferase
VLNTSFNENEPVVCAPKEALDCFLRTRMDMLVLGETVLFRQNEGKGVRQDAYSHLGEAV